MLLLWTERRTADHFTTELLPSLVHFYNLYSKLVDLLPYFHLHYAANEVKYLVVFIDHF